jgi:hypothetical protein
MNDYKLHVNLDHIIAMTVVGARKYTSIVYRDHIPAKRKFIFWTTKEKPAGFYDIDDDCSDEPYTENDLKEGKSWHTKFLVKDKTVFYRPYVEFTLSSKNSRNIQFDDFDEAVKWVNDNILSLRPNVFVELKH